MILSNCNDNTINNYNNYINNELEPIKETEKIHEDNKNDENPCSSRIKGNLIQSSNKKSELASKQ